MQLFITQYNISQDSITIDEDRVVYQLTHVLRAKIGYNCMVQFPTFPTHRYTIQITDFANGSIIGKIVDTHILQTSGLDVHLCVAMPNKFDKIELVVQKCVEIGIASIHFFVAQYSQIRDISAKKIERLEKIALEATEQSYGVLLPTCTFVPTLESLCLLGKNIVLYQGGKKIGLLGGESMKGEKYFFVGPEGGWGEEDKKIFSTYNAEYVSLTSTVLRTETAAILTAWEAMKIT